MIKPKRVLAQTRHHHDGIITKKVFSPFENRPVDDIEMIILEFTGRGLRFELQTLLPNILQGVMPRLKRDERRSIGRSFIDQLTPDSNSKIKIWRGRRRMAVHQDTRLPRRQRVTEISLDYGAEPLLRRRGVCCRSDRRRGIGRA